MRVGYFKHNDVTISETFVFDLISGLKDSDIDMPIFLGTSNKPSLPFSQIFSLGFFDRGEKKGVNAYRMAKILGKDANRARMAVRQKVAKQFVAQALASTPIDVAYVEYAYSAVLLHPILKQKQIPYIFHVHGHDITASLGDPAYATELKAAMSAASKIITASQHMKRLLILEGCNEKKIEVIRLGIDAEKITPMPWEERTTFPPSVIFLGRLTPKKNPIALLHSFEFAQRQLPTARLSIIGDGPLRGEVEERINILGLNHAVTMYGALPRDQSFPILNQHWVYAQHSVTATTGDQEGFGISLAEAAAHELPVVATIHNGIPEQVIHGKTGLLSPEFDFIKMGENLLHLLKNPTEAMNFGRSGRQHIQSLCPAKARIEKILGLLSQLG